MIIVCNFSCSPRDFLFCFLAHLLTVLYRGRYITNPDNALLRANQIPQNYHRSLESDPPQKWVIYPIEVKDHLQSSPLELLIINPY